MDLPRNPLKAALTAGRQQIGLWCTIHDGMIAEMLAGCGFDWLLFDCEHTAMDPGTVLPLVQAVAPCPSHAVVRPSANDPAEIKKLLDGGVQSLVVPYVQTAAEARLAAAAVDYAPGGFRGMAGLNRASRFGAVADYATRARDEICLILQVESVEALGNLDAILAVEGVDAVFVGPADLAASMGHPGNPSHPDVVSASLDAIRRIRAAGKPAGFLTLDAAVLEQAIEAGSLFTAVDIDAALLRRGAMEAAARWRDR
jgi:4-hydroxy-2-oxoheptanedioate aldolase